MADTASFRTQLRTLGAALDQARFRASVTTAHSRADLDEALQIIEDGFVQPMRARGLLRTSE